MASELEKQIDEATDALLSGMGRLLAGQDLDGVKRTDATFLRPGTRVLAKVEGPVRRSSYRAGWQRLAGRVGLLGATGGTGYAYWRDPAVTLQALEYGGIGAASAAAAGGLAYGVLGRDRRELMREWVDPLHQALAQPLGIAEQTDPRRYLHIPLNFTDDDAVIRVDLPVHLRFSRDLVADLIAQKLALPGLTFSWHPAGRQPFVLAKKTRRPPATARFKDAAVRDLVANAPESAPVIGIGAGAKAIGVDLDAESPHILVNASTGGGKSVTLRTITCQMLHHGAQASVLDYKRISHPWARGLPGVTYCADIADIHDTLIQLGQEGRRRVRLAEELGPDADPAAIGPRQLILLEEVNATMKQLARYWEKIRESGDPKISPAIDALGEVLYMGRQVRMHVLLVAQSATVRALGGPEIREQFATRIMARYTMNAWRMLAPEIHPAPKSTKHPGRAQVVVGSAAHETQVIFFTEAEARAWAIGRPSIRAADHSTSQEATSVELHKDPAPPDASALDRARSALPNGPGPETAVHLTPPAPQDPLPATGDTGIVAPPPGDRTADKDDLAVGLREAHDEHLPEITLGALRFARANDPDFPGPAGRRGSEILYHVGDLKRWARNRPRAAIGTTDLP
ncbi:pRL2-11 [Streptomyces flavofungini]|uniref:pRL2-11 n=1 Tax=Streptomyces flavofungini TaxID=68200 RepID=UPI0025AFBE4C|nr:pRL2-11 [Streptomyces flavofungini]WJV51712.1 pRL2-11 [Streptomyces flavofungini]